jgi:predicted RNA-binding protein with PIN domain
MRTLIDGYNVMFAGGLLGQRFGPDGFRKVRHRFLNDLAGVLEPVEAHLTTVVFDASQGPPDRLATGTHKGISVVYAIDVETADDKIEQLIARHWSPKSLTVVSSDHRIQKAAARRKARFETADAFWVRIDTLKRRKPVGVPDLEPEPPRDRSLNPREAAFWLEEFRELAESDEARQAFARDPAFPSDDEVARIAREVEEEFRRG